MQKLKKKFQFLEPSLKDEGHLRSTGDALLLKRLFALCAAQMITVMVNRRSEKRINIRLDRLYLLYFFFELRTFIIEPLLLFKKSLLFRLQRLQARQFFISLHGKGIKKVKAECIIIAIAHNLRKMNGATEKEVA